MRLWFERGFRKKPLGYELMKKFPGHSFLGFAGSLPFQGGNVDSDMELLSKFYKKYPEVKYFPSPTKLTIGHQGQLEV